MTLRPIGAYRLTLALLDTERGDDTRTEEEHEEQRGGCRSACAECEIAKHIQEILIGAVISEQTQHVTPPHPSVGFGIYL